MESMRHAAVAKTTAMAIPGPEKPGKQQNKHAKQSDGIAHK
jgi:hypothetical protein